MYPNLRKYFLEDVANIVASAVYISSKVDNKKKREETLYYISHTDNNTYEWLDTLLLLS